MIILPKTLTGIFIITSLAACSHKTFTLSSEQVRKVPIIRNGFDELSFENNHYTYTCRSNFIAVADGQKRPAKRFTLNLPPSLKYYEAAGINQFAFYFKNRQCLFIHISGNQEDQKDTSFVPDAETVDDLIFRRLTGVWNPSTIDMNKNPLRPDRRTLLINREGVTLLLFNILEKEYPRFVDNGFRLLN